MALKINHNTNLCMTIASILSEVPETSWNSILLESSMYDNIHMLSKKMEYGPFAVLVIILALNDYQLKGKAEKNYWPMLDALLNSKIKNKISKDEMQKILIPFYQAERFADQKIKRMEKFINSPLADKIWNYNAKEVSEHFNNIWIDLSRVMGQKKDKKTIVFSMKCLGRSLIMYNETSFNFDNIPIPVDSRIERITKNFNFTVNNENQIRDIWSKVLDMIQANGVTINMMHLDSFLFKLTSALEYQNHQLFFSKHCIEDAGKKLLTLL